MSQPEYNQKTRLAEEAASPFAKARSFAWPVLFAAAGIATYFAGTALLAEAVGARPAADASALNLAIDLGAMGTTGFLWRNENLARDSRLARLSSGANIAALRAQVVDAGDSKQFVTLSDFRSGRGDARRVVLVLAEAEALRASMADAAAAAADVAAADLLAVPVLVQPGGGRLESPLALLAEDGLASRFEPRTIAVPVETDLAAWTNALAQELAKARSQAGDGVAQRGVTILLKKNGRVGTRRLGTPDWSGLAQDVSSRAFAGLDVTNI